MFSRLDNYERALLGEVVEHPHDEMALHVYADWLLDQDDLAARTRGEHIKIELQLAHTFNRDEIKELRWQAHDLWWNHGESWLGRLYDAVDHFIYDRARLVLEISEATFTRMDPEEIQAAPAWERVTDLIFRDCSVELLRFLAALPRPPFLVELNVPPRSLEMGDLDVVLAEGFWNGLEGLFLRDNALGDDGIRALAEWQGTASLRRLDLENTLIGPAGAEALWRAPGLEQIKKLSVKRNRLDPWYQIEDVPLPSERLLERFGQRVKFA